MHEGLSEAESLRVWSKLVLTLANHIGDRGVIEQAIAIARPAGASDAGRLTRLLPLSGSLGPLHRPNSENRVARTR